MEDRVRVSAIILNPSKTKILLIHRLKDGKEYWVFPGGGVEAGETLGDAMVREIQEETGLAVKKIIENRENDFIVEVDEAKPVMSGPEVQTAADWYNPEWVIINTALKLENLYPTPIMQWFKEAYDR